VEAFFANNDKLPLHLLSSLESKYHIALVFQVSEVCGLTYGCNESDFLVDILALTFVLIGVRN